MLVSPTLMRFALLPVCLTLACATSPSRPTSAVDANGFTDSAKSAAAGIHGEAIASHIRFLADDLLAGRDPGTHGYDVAARYVASELQAIGVQPAGENGTYFQKVRFVRATPTVGSLEVTGGTGAPVSFVKGENFVVLTDTDKGVTDVSADLVFAGHGIAVPEYGYDDFAQVDVKDKVVAILAGAPRSDRPDFFPPLASAVYGQSERVAGDLTRRGARAIIWIWPPAKEAISPFTLVASNYAFDSMRLEDRPPLAPGLIVSTVAFDALLKQAGRTETVADLVAASASGKAKGFEMGLKARVRRESKIRRITSENVVGLLPGDPSSPTGKEMIVYGAHLDHMGIGKPVNGDNIYNGASDDAAGVASLLETARAFTRLGHPPKRGILFVFVTAEERGLLGSEYFARHPTVPLEDVVADIDVDGAYPVHPLKDVVALGTDESSLGGDVARAAAALGLIVSPDPEPEETYFVRSDNFNFVKKGIPAAQTFNGMAGLTPEQVTAERAFWRGRYHQPQDNFEPDRDWEPFAQLTRFNFLVGVSIAQAPARPAWNANSWFKRFPEPARDGQPD